LIQSSQFERLASGESIIARGVRMLSATILIGVFITSLRLCFLLLD
jgi:hypothetical protein